MDIDTQNLRDDLKSDQTPDFTRENFEVSATHGYSDEAIEVFTFIDGECPDTRDRLLMAVMMASPETLHHRQTELYCWYCDNVRIVAKRK